MRDAKERDNEKKGLEVRRKSQHNFDFMDKIVINETSLDSKLYANKLHFVVYFPSKKMTQHLECEWTSVPPILI